MFDETVYRELIAEFNQKLQTFHGTTLATFVEENPFKVEVDDQWITVTTVASGNARRVRRTNAEAALRVLVEEGALTKEQMEDLRGLGTSKATRLFAIIAQAELPGVTAASAPQRTLKYRQP